MPDNPIKSREQEYQETLARPDVREAEFRVLFNQSLTGIAYVARDGTFMRVNRKYAEMLGYAPKELELRRTYQAITHPDDVAADEAEAQATAEGGQAYYRMQKRYIHKQNYSVWVDLQVYRIEAGSGEFVHFLAQTQELRLPDSHLTVQKDADGNPFLTPVVPLSQFLWRNRKWVASVAVPAVLGFFGTAGATIRSHYLTAAKLEQIQQVVTVQEETIRDQKRLIEQLQRGNPGDRKVVVPPQ